ncbi:MAG: hypothetical protein HYT80_08130 [Euryarchaeota archaeon]|nr:hypothetical protein [Euryarchaeota archaeon]
MRGGVLLVVIALFLAGCSEPVAKEVKPPAEPVSTRESKPSGSQLSVSQISQSEADYNFTKIGEVLIRVHDHPAADRPKNPIFWAGGNTTFIRLTLQWFVNGQKPVHSGYTFITFPPLVPVPVASGPPTVVATWGGTAALGTSRLTGFSLPSPLANGYVPVGNPQKVIRESRPLPSVLVFNTNGWGDVYCKVIIEDATLTAPPPEEEAQGAYR